jgi:hypothetical protein
LAYPSAGYSRFGVAAHEILMMLFRREEGTGFQSRHDGRAKGLCLAQLCEIGGGNLALRRALRENGGAITWPCIRPLPVELGRVMRRAKMDLQQCAIADDARIIDNAHRLCMARTLAGDVGIIGRCGGAARIAGGDALHALHGLEHAFHPPEAAARKHGDATLGGINHVKSGGRQTNGVFGRCTSGHGGQRQRGEEPFHAALNFKATPLMQ